MAHPVTRSLTAKEEATWLLRYLPVDHGVANEALCMVVDGRLDRTLLTAALRHVTARHEALRTVFPDTEDGPVAVVLPPAEVDVAVPARDSHPDTVDEDALAFCRGPFDMTKETALRVACFHVGHQDYLCFAFHHLCSDAMSIGVVVDELTTIYDALAAGQSVPGELLEPGPPTLAEPPAPDGVAFWRTHIDGVDPGRQRVSFGRPDPDVPRLSGAGHHHELSRAAQLALPELHRTLRTTENIVMLAAYQLALVLHGAGPDVVVGTRLDGRRFDERTAVGYFANTVPLRTRVDLHGTFADLVAEVGAAFLTGLAHRDVSYESLVTGATRDPATPWRTPLFRHVFNYRPRPVPAEMTCGGHRVRMWVPEFTQSRHDFELIIEPGAGSTWLRTIYSTEIHDEVDIAAFVRRYDHLLAHLADHLDRPMAELPWWTAEDERVVAQANDTDRMTDAPLLLTAVTSRAETAGRAVAIVDGDREHTYVELVAAAAVVRDRLRLAGVGPGDMVALFAERGAPLAAAVLGIWAVGAAYQPIHVEFPANLVAYQLADGGARLVIADRDLPAGCTPPCPMLDMGDPFSGRPAELPLRATPVDPDERAYVMYTSGSTGKPKGAVLNHGNIANQIWHFVEQLGTGPDHAVLWLATFSFDIATLELFLPLAVGGRLVVAPSAARTDPALAVRLVERHEVDVVQATPAVLRLIAPVAGDVLAGTRVLSAGEKLPRSDVQALLDARCRLFNVYGPTESTVHTTVAELTRADLDAIPVGRPISNTKVYVAGVAGVHLPPGVFGEICVAGVGVGPGYLNRPELTAEKFVTDARYGRAYRTGDVGRWRHDGVLELAGRVDRQVKIRGNRVELDAVEVVLSQHPRVRAAAVIHLSGGLHGFVQVAGAGDAALVTEVWNHARENLPAHALPSEITVLDAFPTTPNGKTDWRALAERAAGPRNAATGPGAVEAGDEVLAMLVDLWREMLDDPGLGPDAHFFLSGGDSLLGVRMLVRLGERIGDTPDLTSLLNAPTPAELAALLAR